MEVKVLATIAEGAAFTVGKSYYTDLPDTLGTVGTIDDNGEQSVLYSHEYEVVGE